MAWGNGWAGGLPAEAKWQHRINDLWMTRGDTPVSPEGFSGKAFAALPDASTSATDVVGAKSVLYRRLRAFGSRADVSFIARVGSAASDKDPSAILPPVTVADYLAKLRDVSVDGKNVHGVLAFTNHKVLFDIDEPVGVSWEVISRLRKSADGDPLHRLHWDDYGFASTRASQKRLSSLSDATQVGGTGGAICSTSRRSNLCYPAWRNAVT